MPRGDGTGPDGKGHVGPRRGLKDFIRNFLRKRKKPYGVPKLDGTGPHGRGKGPGQGQGPCKLNPCASEDNNN